MKTVIVLRVMVAKVESIFNVAVLIKVKNMSQTSLELSILHVFPMIGFIVLMGFGWHKVVDARSGVVFLMLTPTASNRWLLLLNPVIIS